MTPLVRDDSGHGLRWRWRRRPKPPAPAPVVPTPPPAPKMCDPVFHGLSAWVANLDDLPPDFVLPLLKRNGFQAIVVKVAHGVDPVEVDAARLQQYRDAEIRTLSWSWCDGHEPEAEAALAATRCSAFGFSGHWANAEKPYDLTAPDGSRDPAAFGRSARWIGAFRAHSAVPLGVSPEPFSGIDHAVWQTAGAAYGPQAYPLENHADVSSVASWGLGRGWQAGQIVPLVEPRFDGQVWDAAEFAETARSHGLPGLALYPADQLLDRPDIWDEIGARWR